MFLTAPLIHDGYDFLPQGAVLEMTDDGVVAGIHYNLQRDDIMQHHGVLCPGFVNVHCHLELSHMKDMIPEHTGLIPFLQKVPLYRTEFTAEQIKAARHEAFAELLQNGIVAVGDIANLSDTLDIRALNKMHVHTFVECIGFTVQHARQRFTQSQAVYEAFAAQETGSYRLRQSIVPHAPYSVSKDVFDLIDKHQPHALLSIHNQEATAEDEFYRSKTGAVTNLLGGFGIDDNFFTPSGKSSLQTYTEWLSAHHPMIFVHNTYTSAEDVQVAQHRFSNTYWCLCPNANKYLENKMPDIDMLQKAAATICIGTDSLASNHQLSVLAELQTLKQHYRDLEWGTLLRWGTLNGAKALQMSDITGSLEPGKKPGLVHISGLESSRHAIQRIF